jgi:hypothetical protein
VVPSNVSVRISASTRLASPNTYALSKNYQLFFRLYLQFAAGTNNQLVTLITSGGTVFNLVHQSSGTCYITGGNIPGLGGSLSTSSLPQTWDSRRLVVNENTAWFMLNGAYTTQATAAKASRSTYASGAVIWASENGASAANYLMDVQLVTCKCKVCYYRDGDTCTACAAGYLAFSVRMSTCTILLLLPQHGDSDLLRGGFSWFLLWALSGCHPPVRRWLLLPGLCDQDHVPCGDLQPFNYPD